MRVDTYKGTWHVPQAEGLNRPAFLQSVGHFIKKAARAFYKTELVDVDAICESEDWPYLWKKD